MDEQRRGGEDRYLDLPGARIAYRVEGPADADPLLVVSHEPSASRDRDDEWGVFDWSPVVAAGGRMLRYDLRGHGASTGRAVQGDYRWPALAGDLLALLDAVSPARPVDALAVASGCGTLLWAAATAPQRFRRLVLVVPPPAGAARGRQAELLRAAAQLAEVLGPDGWARGAAALPVPGPVAEGRWHRNPRPAVAAGILPHVVRGDADSALPEDDVLAGLVQPTLILTWADDPSHPVDAAERLAALLPHGVVEVAADADDIRRWGGRVARFLATAG